MNEVWFKTLPWHPHIRPVEVERSTETSVWIDGRRRARVTTCDSYFPSFEEAKRHLLIGAESKLQSARRGLERAQGEHGNIAGLREDAIANATQQRNSTGAES